MIAPNGTHAVTRWLGGKQQLAERIAGMLPPHKCYVETCGGMGAVMFTKPPSELDVYNDIDGHLVNFFRVLRTQVDDLIMSLNLTPYAREEYLDCLASYQDTNIPTLERARRFYVAVSMAFGGHFGKTGWAFTLNKQSHLPSKWRGNNLALGWFADQMRNWQIDNRTALECIAIYDSPDTCFYVDPPYLPDTRRDGRYHNEMDYKDHETLLAALIACRGKVILSGYDHPLYRDSLDGWRVEMITQLAKSVAKTRKSGYKGAGRITEEQKRIECLYIKPNAIMQQSLWGEAS